jgi:predicted CXXCH cytochrome family protein
MIFSTRWARHQLSAAVLLILGGFATAVFAQDDGGCVTAECHPTIGTAEWVHGPAAGGACVVCHAAVPGAEHEFQFTANGEELCFACHEDSRELMLSEQVHTPVAQGFCTQCHDPHQSRHRYLLKWAPETACFACHEQTEFQHDKIHGPVAVGECTACHDAHASDYEKQLLDPAEDLCFRCHEEKAAIREQRHIHAPAQAGCTVCHEPHASEAGFLLKARAPDLCFDCHSQFVEAVSAEHPHPPVANGQCGECHDPHASPYPALFRVPSTELCYPCHEELQEYIQEQEHLHGPVAQGDCSACHDPHGSGNHVMLHKVFPKDFYAPYAQENYELCFECHNSQMAIEAETETLTGFRDAAVNMHYLHVNKKPKGRTCRACHQVHASSQEKHIRVSVPFGDIDWELPVIFTPAEEGGSCQVGCHAPKGYARK